MTESFYGNKKTPKIETLRVQLLEVSSSFLKF